MIISVDSGSPLWSSLPKDYSWERHSRPIWQLSSPDLTSFRNPVNNPVERWEPSCSLALLPSHQILSLFMSNGQNRKESKCNWYMNLYSLKTWLWEKKTKYIQFLNLGGGYQDTSINTKSLKILPCACYDGDRKFRGGNDVEVRLRTLEGFPALEGPRG